MSGPQSSLLPDGRLHLNHGPIDLIIQAWGDDVPRAYARATARFQDVLPELVAELPLLRLADGPAPLGSIAQTMFHAITPHRPAFITPMAAVAGAVAEAILQALTSAPGIRRAYVNNGGDIALHLAPGQALTCAMAGNGRVRLDYASPARGIATSGRGGRSLSLGIADAVTVLARSAAMADAAATMIANSVDLPGHPAIRRRPARDLQTDSDLGDRLVTIGLAPLTQTEAQKALDAGLAHAKALSARGLIHGAALFLQDQTAILPTPCGAIPELQNDEAIYA